MLAIGAAAALWAGAASVARGLFENGVEPLELATARAVISAGVLALVPASWSRTTSRPDRNTYTAVVLLGLSLALVNFAYYTAIDRLAVAVAIVLQYSAPALVVAWASLLRRRLPPGEISAALLAALAGVVLVSEVATGDLAELDRLGIAMGLASAILFATYTVLSERLEAVYGPIRTLFRAFSVATLFWIVVMIPRGWPAELFDSSNFWRVLFVGVGGTLTPFVLYVWGIGRVRAERASIAATLEPVLAAVFAWVWLAEALDAIQIVGGVLVVGAVVFLQARRRTPLHPEY